MSNIGINFKIPHIAKESITCCGNVGHISKISQEAEYRNKQNQNMNDFIKQRYKKRGKLK